MPGASLSGASSGNADWFILRVPAVTHTVEHEAGTEVVRSQRRSVRSSASSAPSAPGPIVPLVRSGRTNTAA